MKTIKVNGRNVKVSVVTIRCIAKIAKEKKLSFSDAVFYCLKRSIDLR